MRRSTTPLLLIALATDVACADKTPEPEGPPIGKHVLRPGEPPPGAFEACGGKTAGITCTIGHRVGTCGLPRSGEPRLACLTEGGPGAPPSN
ncbi:MAG: hypothetical protein U0270_15395 [Labilithrix sp.]